MIKRKAFSYYLTFMFKPREREQLTVALQRRFYTVQMQEGIRETESGCRNKGSLHLNLPKWLLSSGFPSYVWNFICNLQVFYFLKSHKNSLEFLIVLYQKKSTLLTILPILAILPMTYHYYHQYELQQSVQPKKQDQNWVFKMFFYT